VLTPTARTPLPWRWTAMGEKGVLRRYAISLEKAEKYGPNDVVMMPISARRTRPI
jgi:hypothetical protein